MKKAKGKAAALFKLKEKIVGTKVVSSEVVIIVDPKTKSEVTNPNDISPVVL